MQVQGPQEYNGKPGVKFSNSRTGTGFLIDIDGAKDPTVVRAVISKPEAERRLALLEDTTPVTDTRSAKERYIEHARTMARGTDLQKLALLRAQYASTFSAGARNMVIYYLEDAVLPELAHVLATSQEKLARSCTPFIRNVERTRRQRSLGHPSQSRFRQRIRGESKATSTWHVHVGGR